MLIIQWLDWSEIKNTCDRENGGSFSGSLQHRRQMLTGWPSEFLKCFLVAYPPDSYGNWLHINAVQVIAASLSVWAFQCVMLNHRCLLRLKYYKIVLSFRALVLSSWLPSFSSSSFPSPFCLCTPRCMAIAELSLDLLPKSTAKLSTSLPPTL